MAWVCIDPQERFMRHVLKDESGCWLWTGNINKRWGYGCFFVGRPSKNSRQKIQMRAHRFSYLTFKGLIPAGMLVCHSCDVRHCVNPSHLFLGSYKDNIQDMIAKGRQHPGIATGEFLRRARQAPRTKRQGKFTSQQIAEIRNSKETGRAIAFRLGVSDALISRIRNGLIYV